MKADASLAAFQTLIHDLRYLWPAYTLPSVARPSSLKPRPLPLRTLARHHIRRAFLFDLK